MTACLFQFCINYRLPPVCRAFAIISRHLSLMESEVTGARGNVLINVLGATSVASLLLLELLLELLWGSKRDNSMDQRTSGAARGETSCGRIDTTNTFRHGYLSGVISSYLSSFASGLPCDGDTTGVVCSFLLSSEGLSPPPGSSGAQEKKKNHTFAANKY